MNAKAMGRQGRMMLCGLAALASMVFASPVTAREEHCADCGTVVTTNRRDEKGSGTTGAVVGGVGGALAGNVIGHNTASTVIGGIGGAVAGDLVGKHMTSKKIWSVQVRMDNGRVRNIDYADDPGFKQGQRVRVSDGRLARM